MVEEVKVLSRSRATTILLRRKSPPWGFKGGKSANPGKNIFFPGTKKERIVSTEARDMESGDVIRVISAGGGGWGDPMKRDEKSVAMDVEFGYVTRAGAKKDYGVVVKSNLSSR